MHNQVTQLKESVTMERDYKPLVPFIRALGINLSRTLLMKEQTLGFKHILLFINYYNISFKSHEIMIINGRGSSAS